MKTTLILVCVLMLVGCSTVVDHTKNPHTQDLLGLKETIEDLFLCRETERDENRPDTTEVVAHSCSGEHGCWIADHELLAKIPKGTVIEIRRIEERKFINIWKYQLWNLLGDVIIDDEKINFYYRYTMTTDSPDLPSSPAPLPWQ